MLALERKHRAPYPKFETVTGNRGETIMPVKIFYVQGTSSCPLSANSGHRNALFNHLVGCHE